MHSIEDYWNDRVKEEEKIFDEISGHPEQYPGKYICTKWLRNANVRQAMVMKHNWVCWLHYYTPILKPEDLYTLDVYKKQLDSLKACQQ